jgi:hypothetical protein
MKFRKVLLWIIASSLLNIGCVVFHPESLSKDSLGYRVRHYNSCGPEALEEAFSRLGEKNVDRIQISRNIQDTGNTLRYLMMLVHHDTILVSFPHEMKNVCKKYGYEMVEVDKEIDDLDPQKDIAIVLLFGDFLKGESHWAAYPHTDNIKNWFGSNTKISKIFILKKIN